jgi:hypothetical protein
MALALLLIGPVSAWSEEPPPMPAAPPPPSTPTPPPASVLVPSAEDLPIPAPSGLLDNRVVGALLASESDQETGAAAGEVVFSADGERAAYILRDEDQFAVVLLDKQRPLRDESFTEVGTPVFSADGAQLAYVASRAITGRRRGLVSVGGGLGRSYTDEKPEAGERPKQSFLVVGSRTDPTADLIVWRIYSPAGTAAGYLADRGTQKAPIKEFVSLESRLANPKTPVALLGPETQTVRAETTQWLGPVAFSPDGQRLALPATCGDVQFMVYGTLNDADFGRGPALEEVGPATFSPDGRSLLYTAKKTRLTYLLVNESLYGPFDAVYPPVRFDADAHAWAANVRLGSTLHRVLIPPD